MAGPERPTADLQSAIVPGLVLVHCLRIPCTGLHPAENQLVEGVSVTSAAESLHAGSSGRARVAAAIVRLAVLCAVALLQIGSFCATCLTYRRLRFDRQQSMLLPMLGVAVGEFRSRSGFRGCLRGQALAFRSVQSMTC